MKSDVNSTSPTVAQLLITAERLKQGLGSSGGTTASTSGTTSTGTNVGGDIAGPESVEHARLRHQLQAALQSLLLADLELALDHKAEQELWNACFKSQIAVMQTRAKDKKLGVQQKEWQATLYLFLDSALGFYTVLLNQLCHTYDIDLPFRRYASHLRHIPILQTVRLTPTTYTYPSDDTPHTYDIDLPFRRKDSLLTGAFQSDKENRPAGASRPAASRSSCCYVVQDCLVHMGDVARYRGKVKQAESCYRHAVSLLPSSGQPYNQLALLEAQHGDGISAVYYYVRSVAVRQPFPAATTNLAKLYSRLSNNSSASDPHARLTAAGYTSAFLQLHARMHQRCEPRSAQPLLAALSAQLPRLLLTNSLSTWRLLQMLAITVQAAHAAAGRPDGGGSLEPPASSSAADRRAFNATLQLAATTLDSLLRTAYRLQDSEARRHWSGLPVVRLYVSWLSELPAALAMEPFSTRPQIWSHLCHLVNGLAVTAETMAAAADNRLPLPEDVDLAAFLPLSGCQRGLKMSRPPVPEPEQAVVRAVRLRVACERLARHGVVWSAGAAGVLQSAYSVEERQVLAQLNQAEAELVDESCAFPDPERRPVSSPETPSAGGGEPPLPLGPVTGVTTTVARADPKTGILKSEAPGTGRRRQNVALQAIIKSGTTRAATAADEMRNRDSRQVTFRTPSPTPLAPPPSLPAPTPPQQPRPPPQPTQSLQPPALSSQLQQQQSQMAPRHLQQQQQQQYLQQVRARAAAAAAVADTWRQPQPAMTSQMPAPAAWPPPRPPHPLDEKPTLTPAQQGLQFNPMVPPPGWATQQGPHTPQQTPGWPLGQPARSNRQGPGSASDARGRTPTSPFDALKQPLWSGWPAAAAAATVHRQPNPLAAMLSQCRAPTPTAPAAHEPAPGRSPRDGLGVYSLFPSAPAPEVTARGAAYSLFPSSSMHQQSMWPSAGPSPLERLIEQQRQQSSQGKP